MTHLSICRDAVVVYSSLLCKRHAAEITLQEALDEWTTYVASCDVGGSTETADVLSTLFTCLTLSLPAPISNESSLHSSSAALHAFSELHGDHETSPSPRGHLNRLLKRRGVASSQLTPNALTASTNGRPSAPPDDSSSAMPNPRRNSLRSNRESIRAPEQGALEGGLEEGDCEGFKLE